MLKLSPFIRKDKVVFASSETEEDRVRRRACVWKLGIAFTAVLDEFGNSTGPSY